MLFITKADILLLMLVMGILAYRLARLGRVMQEGTDCYCAHIRTANRLIISVWALIGLVLLMEGFRDMPEKKIATPPSLLLSMHLLFAISFLLAIHLMRFWITGERYPVLHRNAGRFIVLPAYVLMAITGTVLLLRFS